MRESNRTNLNVFLGVIKGVSEKTDSPIPPHLKILIGDDNLNKPEDLEEAIKSSGQLLEDEQCACLFANVVNLCIKDGRVKERSLVMFSQKHLRLDWSEAKDVQEAIEARFQVGHVFRDKNEWAAFCGGLIAIVEADNDTAAAEDAYLKHFVEDHSHIDAGRMLLKENGRIGEELGKFNSRQKKCLAAHAISIMLIDGDWKASEQKALDILSSQMDLSDIDAEKLLKGIYTLFNLSVFA